MADAEIDTSPVIPYVPGQIGVRLTKPSTAAPDDSAPPDTSTPPALLSTPFSSIVGGPPKQYQPPPRPVLVSDAGPFGAGQRIVDAIKEGYAASKPDILPETGPLSRPELEKYPINREFNLPWLLDPVRTALGVLGGGYRGAQQIIKENLDELNPYLSQVGKLDPSGAGWGHIGPGFLKTSGASPLSNAIVTAPDAFAGSPQTFRDITEAHPGIPYRQEPVVGVRNAAAAIDRGNVGMQNLRESRMSFAPDFVNEGIDKIVPEDAQALARAKMAGPSAVVDMQQKLQAFKDQPMSVQQYQGMLQGLGDAIDDEYSKNGVTTVGDKLLEMRHQLKEHFETANASDLASGDPSTIGKFLDANRSYSQGFKMQDMERMLKTASQTENPTASMKTQMKNYLDNEAKTRGWSDDEIKAAERAGERGAWGSLYYALGSRLAKGAGGVVGGMFASSKDFGPIGVGIGTALGAGAAEVGGMPARWLANRVARTRLQQALDVLGQSVPARPLRLPEADPGSVPPPPPQPGPLPQPPPWGAWDTP